MIEESHSAGGVIIGPRGLIVVTNQDGVAWSLPKGRLEPGEDEQTAACREIEEETGLKHLEFAEKLGTYSRYKIGKDGKGEDKSIKKTITIFLYKTQQEELKPTDPAHPEARWVEPDKVADLLTHPKDKEFFISVQAAAMEGSGGVVEHTGGQISAVPVQRGSGTDTRVVRHGPPDEPRLLALERAPAVHFQGERLVSACSADLALEHQAAEVLRLAAVGTPPHGHYAAVLVDADLDSRPVAETSQAPHLPTAAVRGGIAALRRCLRRAGEGCAGDENRSGNRSRQGNGPVLLEPSDGVSAQHQHKTSKIAG
jgi:ADP-ribose pyrophosphatase YjhB (NUDIX family)